MQPTVTHLQCQAVKCNKTAKDKASSRKHRETTTENEGKFCFSEVILETKFSNHSLFV